MAKRLKDLSNWEVKLDSTESDPATPTRRSRRGQTQDSKLIRLHREEDGTTLCKGDCVLLSEDPRYHEEKSESYYGVIVELKLGIQTHLEMHVLPFVSAKDIDSTKLSDRLENELLITCESHLIFLNDFVEKVQILSQKEYSKEARGNLLASSVFVCRRATDRSRLNFSAEFDFIDWRLLLMENTHEAISFLTDKTSIIISPKKAKREVKSIQDRRQPSPSPSKTKYNVDSDSEDRYSDDSQFSLSSEEEEQPDDQEFAKGSPRKRKSDLTKPSPRKRARDVVKTTGAFKGVMSVLSPLNKGFKVKYTASASSLPSLSINNYTPANSSRSETSEAFRELREKLHTSTRISLLPCREEQFEELYVNLESAVTEGVGCCLYVSGTPGVGKTATIREAITSLRDSVVQGYVDDFDFLEINSLKLVTPITAYEKLWQHLTGIKVTPSNASLLLEEYFGRKEADSSRKPLIVVIDELDQLVTKNQNVMYNFFNWPTYPNSKLIVIAIANTMDLPERILSNKIASRLGLRRVGFKGYTEDELGVIIAHRLTLLGKENKKKVTISHDAMSYASKKVALVSGDARRALTICRRAVEIAEEECLETSDTKGVREDEQTFSVRISHISLAISETINSPLSRFLSLLPFASKLMLAGLLLRMRRSGLGEVPMGAILDEMRNSLSLLTSQSSSRLLREVSDQVTYMSFLYSDDPTSKTATKVRIKQVDCIVNGLVEQGILLQQKIIGKRYRLVSLNVSEDEILSVLRKDDDFAAMVS